MDHQVKRPGKKSLQSAHRGLPDGFVYLADEIPSLEFDLCYATTDNFVGTRIDGYFAARAILTREASVALGNVQEELSESGLGLKIFDSYRPQRAVDQFVRWTAAADDPGSKRKYYPDIDKKSLIPEGYLAMQSSHSRGSTLDLTIVSISAEIPEELDMGTPFDYFGPESWPDSNTVSQAQKENRMMLRSLMDQNGFRPLKQEWWHFTLADEPFPDTYFDFPVA